MTPAVAPSRRETLISAALLCLLSAFMAEVLSSNQTPLSFVVLSWGLLIVYGFPILLIRELAIRLNRGLPSLLLMGFGYGFYNEGLIAKTLLLNHKVPWNTLDNYFFVGGINWGWLLVICSFHSLFSIITPLFVLEKLRPQTANRPWLSLRSGIFLAVVVAFVSLGFFSNQPHVSPLYFWLFWLAIAAFFGVALVVRAPWPMPRNNHERERALVWWGIPLLITLFLLSAAAQHGLPFPLFALGWAVIIAVALVGIKRFEGWSQLGILLYGLGCYMGMGLTIILVAQPISKVTEALAVIAIFWLLRRNFRIGPALPTSKPSLHPIQ